MVCRGGRAGSARAAATGPSRVARARGIAATALLVRQGAPPVDARLVEVVLDNCLGGLVAMRVGTRIPFAFSP